jgi:hypothetical protein
MIINDFRIMGSDADQPMRVVAAPMRNSYLPIRNVSSPTFKVRAGRVPACCWRWVPPWGSTAADTLSGIQTYQLGNGQGHAMLLPTGTASCVAISSTAIAQ